MLRKIRVEALDCFAYVCSPGSFKGMSVYLRFSVQVILVLCKGHECEYSLAHQCVIKEFYLVGTRNKHLYAATTVRAPL